MQTARPAPLHSTVVPRSVITCPALWLEIASANADGQLYADPPREDVERRERLDVLAAEGLIKAGRIGERCGWLVALGEA